jgi:hypothetical protein
MPIIASVHFFVELLASKCSFLLQQTGFSVKNSVALANDHRLSAKLVPTFADRGVSRGQRNGSPGRILGFLDQSLYYFFHIAP